MGPNLYAQFPCIKWKIDIGPFEERPTNTIDGFLDLLRGAQHAVAERVLVAPGGEEAGEGLRAVERGPGEPRDVHLPFAFNVALHSA